MTQTDLAERSAVEHDAHTVEAVINLIRSKADFRVQGDSLQGVLTHDEDLS